jgi:murein DD-endopeptidase MepM/ murein hydrolase activator NlpD
MAYPVEVRRSGLLLRASVLALIAVGFAGCSSDVTRFDSNPFGSRTGAPEVTGSIPPRAPAVPAGRVESQPLPQTTMLPPPPPRNPSRTGVAEGAGGLGSYRPQTQATYTPSVPPAHAVAVARPAAPRVAMNSGRREIVVQPGETLAAIARHNGVSIAELMRANNITTPNSLKIGQRLIVPSQHSARALPEPARPAAPPRVQQARATAPATVPAAPAYGGFHVAGPGDTVSKIAHRYRVSVAELERVNKLKPHAQIRVGERLIIPARTSSLQAPVTTQASAVAAAPAPQAAPAQHVATATPTVRADLAKANDNPPEAEHGHALFRWPARGRIVATFGTKPNGQQNDGINIALPEGTPIKAAEAGEVAYAGNELKGYGNLVLIRHPNGYVTAYAHASELLVKRGEKVKRGQVIAKSGQTGNVSSPQLHFEIRKGSSPVDPMPYLG